MNRDIDLNLTLDMDSYLKQFDSFKFVDTILNEYTKTNSNLINFRNFNYESIYPKIADFINVISLKKELDIEELYFISYITYRLKGSTDSLKTILDFVQCEPTVLIEYNQSGDRVLTLNLDYIEVVNPYLAERNLLRLCKDLLYFTKFSIKIKNLAVIYKIEGETNKTYYNVSSYYADTEQIITDGVSYNW